MLWVSHLFIYPIKSLGGISVSSSLVTSRGLQHDRRWMLVDENHEFLSQRILPQMALLQAQLTPDGLQVKHKKSDEAFFLPFEFGAGQKLNVQVWADQCIAETTSKEADAWFSEMLSIKCRLVYMPEETNRQVDTHYARNNEITSFSDGFPFLLIGQSSLDDLNRRLPEPLPMNRFRPNVVVSGSTPYEEDQWRQFLINRIQFYGVKPCARCTVTTIDQEEAQKEKEPLKTLATYRMKNNTIYFGQNLLHQGNGKVNVGDEVFIQDKNPALFL